MKSVIFKKPIAYKKYERTALRTSIKVVSFFIYAISIAAIIASGLVSAPKTEAAVTKLINFQGKLTTVSNGTNVADGSYSFEFKMYTASSGGSPVWTETWDGGSGPCPQLAVTKGVFNAKLGACSSLASVDFSGGSMYVTVNFNPGAGYDGEMSPRKQIGSTAYAMLANGVSGDGTVQNTVSSTTALAVAKAGTDYALQVDTSAGSAVTGLKVTSNAAASGLALAVISSGTDENLTIDAKGAGTVSIGASSTGNILLGGGSASTGCTVTNSTGAFACTAGGSFTTLALTGAITGASSYNGLVITPNTGVITTGTWNGTDIAVADGGTGASTSQAAINNLSQLTTNGDLLYYNGTNSTRLARGADTECLKSNTTTLVWGSCGSGSQTPWTSDIDADSFSLLDFGTGITARAGLTITSTSANLALATATSGNITLAPASTGSVQVTSGTTTGTTTTSALALNANSLTSGTGLYIASSTLSSGSLVDLQVSGTAGVSSQKVINVATTGAITGTQTTYGGYFSNTHSGGTSTNVGLYATATGGTNNYAAIFENGRVGIGTNAPVTDLHISGLTSEIRLTDGGNDSSLRIRASGAEANFDLYNDIGETLSSAIRMNILGENEYSVIGVDPSIRHAFYVNNNEVLIVRNDENVTVVNFLGVGIADPQHTLDVDGSSHFDGGAMFDYTAAGLTQVRITGGLSIGDENGLVSTGDQMIASYSDVEQKFYYGSSGTTGLIIDGATGNVGIGLAAPTSLLHVQQSADSAGISTPVAFDINSVGAAGELTASSGVQTFARLAPVINQTSTAGYTALLVNSTHTGTGSGAKLLQDWQVGGSSVAKIDSTGALTVTSCTGCGGGGTTWDTIGDAAGNGAIAMGTTEQTMDWDFTTTAHDGMIFNFDNNGGTAGADNGIVINNAVSTNASGDLNTENLLLLQQLDTTGTGTTVVDNALKIDVAANSGITDGIEITNSAGNLTNGINIVDTAGGTITTGLLMSGTFTNYISTPNFVVANSGNIDTQGTVQAGSSNITLTLASGMIDADALTLVAAADGRNVTSSASGLSTYSDGLSLLQGCTDGQILKWVESTDTWDCAADTSGSGTTTTIVKSANQAANQSSTTFQDVTELVFAMTANKTYIIEGYFPVDTSNTTADLKYTVTVPSGATLNIFANTYSTATAVITCNIIASAQTCATTVNNTVNFIHMRGFIANAGTAGNFQVRFAQNTSAAASFPVIKKGSTLFYTPTTGADLAETYFTDDVSIEAGDVVSLDPDLAVGVKKSSSAYDKNLLGIISTRPGLLLGDETSDGMPVPVALSGRVPVKVIAQNGPIYPGDLLTSSSTPGVAMKATKAGIAIGQAMTGFDGDGIGVIMAFIKNSYFHGIAPTPPVALESLETMVDEGIELEAQSESGDRGKDILNWFLAQLPEDPSEESSSVGLSELYTDRVGAGLEVITPRVIAKGLEVDSIGSLSGMITLTSDVSFFGRPYFHADTAGFGIIKTGMQSVDIIFSREYIEQPIVNATITLDQPPEDADGSVLDQLNDMEQELLNGDLRYIITRKSAKGFTIKLAGPAPVDMQFSWTALLVKKPHIFASKSKEDKQDDELKSKVLGAGQNTDLGEYPYEIIGIGNDSVAEDSSSVSNIPALQEEPSTSPPAEPPTTPE